MKGGDGAAVLVLSWLEELVLLLCTCRKCIEILNDIVRCNGANMRYCV